MALALSCMFAPSDTVRPHLNQAPHAGRRQTGDEEHFAFQAPRQRINWKKLRQVNLDRLVSIMDPCYQSNTCPKSFAQLL